MATASNNNKKSKSGTKKKTATTKAAAAKTADKKTAAPKKAPIKKTAAKKSTVKKAAAAKTATAKKAAPKKASPKKAAPKKAVAKKTTPKKTPSKKAPAKKAVTARKTSAATSAPKPAAVKTPEHQGHMSVMFLAGLAFFAVLAYGILQSGRDGSATENEHNLITASQMIQYGVSVENGVQKLGSKGVALSQINFDTEPEDDDAKALFSPAGGEVLYEDPPWRAARGMSWRFLDVSDARDGFMVSGMGSDAAVRGREVVMYLDGLSPAVCELMRKGWGLDPEAPVQEVKVDFEHRAANHAGANATTFYATPGRDFSCFRNGRNGSYVYYYAVAVQ